MEPTGIEPVTSCLQSPSEGGRMWVACGSMQAIQPISEGAAGLDESHPGRQGFHEASKLQRPHSVPSAERY